jgi:flagellar hook protein FlgE
MTGATDILSGAYLVGLKERDNIAANLGMMNADGADGVKSSFTTTVSGSLVTGINIETRKTTDTKGSIYSTADMPDSYFAVSGGDGLAIINRKDGKGIAYTNLMDFKLQSDGTYENSAGNKLMGIKFNPDGTLPAGGAIRDNLTIVKLDILNSKPTPTSKIDVSMRIPAIAPAQNPAFTAQIYDTLGIAHTVTGTFTRTGANAWQLNAAVTNGVITAPGGGGPTNITFNNDGTLATIGGAATGTLNFTFDFSAGGATNNQAVALNLGTPGQALGLVQAGEYAVTYNITPDGSRASDPLNNSFDKTGIISTVFKEANQPQKRYQIVLAKFDNPNGLDDIAGTGKVQSITSGEPSFQIPGLGNAGVLEPKHLTKSNIERISEMLALTHNATGGGFLVAAIAQSNDVENEFKSRI